MFNLFKKSYSPQETKTFDFLHQNHFFKDLDEEELASFLPFLYLRSFSKGEVIFFRGDPSQAFYVIQKGVVALSIDIQDSFEELTRLRATEAFGDNALIETSTRLYNAVCYSEHSDIYVIPTTNILNIFEENLTIKSKMMTAMAQYYDRYNTRLVSAYKESFGFFSLAQAYKKKPN